MKFDFETVADRRGKDAIAIDIVGKEGSGYPEPDEGFDVIPMWVADMNFPTVPTIQEEITKRVSHPMFGYFETRDEYYDAIISWQKERNGAEGITKECIGYENGVLGGVNSVLSVICSKGDKVLLHSPCYVGFTHVMKNNGYTMVLSEMKKDEQGIYRMDFEDMEEKLKTEHIHAAVFCSPHNPAGRVWERWEIEKAMELYRKYDVFVISDEIWSDLIMPGHKHIPTQSVSEDARMRTAAMYAPSKTFNLAGLIGSYHIIYNPWLRDRVRKESSLCHYNSMNILSQYALMGAYSRTGQEWLDQLLQVLDRNETYAADFIHENFEGVEVTKAEGTYMLFVDCTAYCEKHQVSLDALLMRAWKKGVIIQDGRAFFGPCHIRMNLALPYSRVQEAFARMKQYVFCD